LWRMPVNGSAILAAAGVATVKTGSMPVCATKTKTPPES
jgi:hypothetical protein